MGNLKKILFGVFILIPALLFCQEDGSSQVKYGALTQIHLSYAENDSTTNLYKVPTMTFIERPAITLHWKNNAALLAYRTTGVQVHGHLFDKKFYYAFILGNPAGADFFNASGKNPVNYNEINGFSYWSRLEHTIAEKFVTGVFYNLSTNTKHINTNGIMHSSWGGHILFKREKLNFMAEYIT
jgi:hypothetical protein